MCFFCTTFSQRTFGYTFDMQLRETVLFQKIVGQRNETNLTFFLFFSIGGSYGSMRSWKKKYFLLGAWAIAYIPIGYVILKFSDGVSCPRLAIEGTTMLGVHQHYERESESQHLLLSIPKTKTINETDGKKRRLHERVKNQVIAICRLFNVCHLPC